MDLGNRPVPGRPTIWMIVGQGPTVLAVGAGGGCLDIFTLVYPFSSLSPSLWETARYRLKYCLKGPLNPNQPTNQLIRKARESYWIRRLNTIQPHDTNDICSAVFALAINRLHSFKRQPFWFHNLNSMVPVKGIVLLNLVFFESSLFSIHIAFLLL